MYVLKPKKKLKLNIGILINGNFYFLLIFVYFCILAAEKQSVVYLNFFYMHFTRNLLFFYK